MNEKALKRARSMLRARGRKRKGGEGWLLACGEEFFDGLEFRVLRLDRP